MKSISDLIECVRRLGLRLGVKYWNLNRRCRKDPSIVQRWVMACRLEADRLDALSELPENAKLYRAWADDLERFNNTGDKLANVAGEPRRHENLKSL